MTKQKSARRDPAAWSVERDDHPSGRFFLLRNGAATRSVLNRGPFGWKVWNADGSHSYTVTSGKYTPKGSCTCPGYPNTNAGEHCEHTACVEAVVNFLADEKVTIEGAALPAREDNNV